ncbi:MAG: methyltransferase domain-containing protein [Solidesulfovibrio sp. DCME]|uniref:methyltransferase domain-containing protein n=1 Tax=Solidesulfovibrio sp. DCME TaxID=3447380 RepID=UPI003D125501
MNLLRDGHAHEAEDLAGDWTRRYPDDVFGWSVLGSLRLTRGLAAAAEPCLARAVALAPDVADLHVNLGLARADCGDGQAALACYDAALARNPACVPALTNRGAALQAAGRLAEAVASYDAALRLSPDHAKAHYNRANAVKELGQFEEALAGYDRALALVPDYAYALAARGILRAEAGQMRRAEADARAALLAAPDLPQALDLLARCLLSRAADPAEVLALVERSLALDAGLEAKRLFVECLHRLPPQELAGSLARRLATALAEPWDRPERLVPVAARVLEHDALLGPALARAVAAWPTSLAPQDLFGPDGPGACGDNGLLTETLAAGPVCTLPLERFCTLARRCLLEAGLTGNAAWEADSAGLRFFTALAGQCRVNEYAFAEGDDEARLAEALAERLDAALRADGAVSALAVLAVAAYRPVNGLAGAEALARRPWPAPVAAALGRWLAEDAEERGSREAMPRLTPIEDEVSRRVRRQYEENPYPRWIRAAPVDEPQPFDAFLSRRFPFSSFAPLGRHDRLDILVAGCGSGQHALETARRLRGAQVLAVDLSLSSLAYAKRKARELGVANITFAQADILRLGAIDRRFDVIESTGVLHHLHDPMAGWRALLALLRPGGCMRLGFYSDLARRDIPRLRVMLQAKGYVPTPQSLRQCRQELLSLPETDPARRLLVQDFYSISGCRDLFFHVCESAMTLPAIAAFLDGNGLRFLGFDIEPATLATYRARFPSDPAATNLDNWHVFERENQDTFLEMYQFWIQKGLA